MKSSLLFISGFHLLTKFFLGLALFYQFIFSPLLVLFTIQANQSEGFLITQIGLNPEQWKPMKEIESVNSAIIAIGIKHESALLRMDFSHWQEWLNIPVLFYFFFSFTKGLLGIFIVYNLVRISGHLKRQHVFVASNVHCIRYIGFSLLAIPLAELLSKISIKPYISSQVKITGYQLMQTSVIWNIDYQWIFAGLLILVLAQVFNEGVQLQQEKDLTI